MLESVNEKHKFGLSTKLNNEFIAIGIIFIVLFFFLFKSPVHPLRIKNTLGTDSAVFQTIAMVMEQGGRPYTDIFDHKGPLLYLLNYLGYIIGPIGGILYIEYLFLIVSFFFLYKIARLRVAPQLALIICGLALSLLYKYYEGGNLTEEYALLFISISLFYFSDYLENQRITRIRVAICGACFASVCLLRANMIALWCVFCLAISGQCLLKHEYSRLIEFAICFVAGVVCVLLPCIVWLIMRGMFKDFCAEYVLFNALYTGRHAHGWTLRLQVFWSFFRRALHVGAFFFSMILYLKERKYWLIVFAYLLCNLCLIALPGNYYRHYGMIMIPAIVLPLSAALELCISNRRRMMTAIYVYAIVCLSALIPLFRDVIRCFTNERQTIYSECVDKVCSQIKKYSRTRDKITVYGNWCEVYLRSERLPATKYAYQFPIGEVSTVIMDDYFKSLALEQPPVIVVQNSHYDKRIQNYISKNNYQSVGLGNGEYSKYCAGVFIREIKVKCDEL